MIQTWLTRQTAAPSALTVITSATTAEGHAGNRAVWPSTCVPPWNADRVGTRERLGIVSQQSGEEASSHPGEIEPPRVPASAVARYLVQSTKGQERFFHGSFTTRAAAESLARAITLPPYRHDLAFIRQKWPTTRASAPPQSMTGAAIRCRWTRPNEF